MERQFKGIWIPAEIWEAPNLTWNEKVVLMEIDSFTSAGKDCFISDEYIGNLVGCSPRTARTIVSKLIKLGYVIKTKSDGRRRFLVANIAEQIGKICRADRQNLPPTNNYDTYIENTIKEKNYIRKENFVKPSVAEVSAYCKERGNQVDPQTFVDFYESKGWMVGKNRMKDWRSAVRLWEKRDQHPQPQTPSPAPKKESLVDYYRRILGDLHEQIDQQYGTGIDNQ